MNRWLLASLAIGMVAITAIALLWPTPVDGGFVALVDRFIPEAVGGEARAEVQAVAHYIANIVLFVPVGFLLVLFSRHWWVGAVVGVVLSASCETAQGLLLPARFPSIDDVTANTLGSVAGSLVAAIIVFLGEMRQSRRRASNGVRGRRAFGTPQEIFARASSESAA